MFTPTPFRVAQWLFPFPGLLGCVIDLVSQSFFFFAPVINQ